MKILQMVEYSSTIDPPPSQSSIFLQPYTTKIESSSLTIIRSWQIHWKLKKTKRIQTQNEDFQYFIGEQGRFRSRKMSFTGQYLHSKILILHLQFCNLWAVHSTEHFESLGRPSLCLNHFPIITIGTVHFCGQSILCL